MNKEFKSASSVKIGKKFKERRIELGHSIEEVSKILFVNKTHLTSIEEGNYAIFPSEVFAKAYFNKYLNFLEIHCEFPSVFELNAEKKHKRIFKEFSFDDTFNNNIKYYLSIFLVFSAILLGVYFFSNEEVISKNEINNIEEIKKEEIKLDDIFKIEEDVNQIEDKSNLITKDIQNNNLLLEFYGECWLELYVNDELIEAKLFFDNERYLRNIKMPFKIIIGNADFVKGSYNNTKIDFITNANRLTRVNTIIFNE